MVEMRRIERGVALCMDCGFGWDGSLVTIKENPTGRAIRGRRLMQVYCTKLTTWLPGPGDDGEEGTVVVVSL